MLDLKFVINNIDKVQNALINRGLNIKFDIFLKKNDLRRKRINTIEKLRSQRNKLSHFIGDSDIRKLNETVNNLITKKGEFDINQSILILYLKSIIPEWYSRVTAGVYVLHMLNSSEGKIYYFPEIMAVYRRHVGGVWSYKSEIDMLTEWLNMLKYLIEHFKNNLNVHKNLENQYANIAMRLSMLFEKNNDSINAIDYFSQSIILSNQVTEDFLKKFIELELKDNLSQNTISSKLINYYKHPERIIFLVKRLLKIKN